MNINTQTDKQFDEQIKEQLSQYKVVPPNSYWEKLTSKLDTLPTQASAPHAFMPTMALKTTIAIVFVVAVGVLVFFLVNSTDERDNALLNNTMPNVDTLSTQEQDNILKSIENEENTTKIQPKPKPIIQATSPHGYVDISKESTPNTLIAEIGLNDSVLEREDISFVEKNNENQDYNNNEPKVQETPKFSSQQVIQEPKVEENFVWEEDKTEMPILPNLFIPNIITPNGDGYNDCFEIQGKDSTGLNHLIVFNGLGRIVFEQQHYDNNWCGENLPDNVYYYYFKFTFGGEQYLKKGSITIKR